MLTHSTLCSHVHIKVHYETFNTQKTNRYGISKKGFVIHVTIEMKTGMWESSSFKTVI